ncbi:Pentatricopeptide repeat protein [Coniochaeta hoffmannii]|uniref:Pentatricopeptide repeat protein n=1 Tax=Coniochaeta hoffmannii TaxID=91930 RepID=A0AA38R4H8_9PEZI|nr:Pentatricopeptide repeat protein [Coniochaeta hoffmannii]
MKPSSRIDGSIRGAILSSRLSSSLSSPPSSLSRPGRGRPTRGTVEEHLNFYKDPYRRGYAPADGPNVMVSDRRDDIDFPSLSQVKPADEEEQQILSDLRRAINARLRRPGIIRLDTIYHIYQQLPEPRMSHLPAKLRHGLLRVLGTPQKRTAKSMLRYFAVVADVKNSGLPLIQSEWNFAIAYAARYVGWSTNAETESALSLWREMEREAGIKGNEVTFNILFDVASKSGNFALAEMIYQEMEARGHPYNRYHYVSLIHFFGLKHDTDGLRAAYREMVEAGEMVDTVVLNCVMAGLLRSGEEDAAERVYERMRASSPKSRGMPQRTYATNKMITQALMMFARVGRQHPEMARQLQLGAPMAPDLQTYRLLINHYGVKLGDLSKVAQYLDEMKFFQVELHGSIFLALFKSFAQHGGYPGAAWSEQRLNSIWAALLQALDEGVTGLTVETWLAGWALKAFKKCSTEQRIMEAYEALEARWDLEQADRTFMMDFLHKLLDENGTVAGGYKTKS